METDTKTIEESTTTVGLEAAPDAKTRRYDRQLRLWAASGQSALENARILVIGATATATSVLKNLVLPGIGHFTILDPAVVSPADAGNNFFLEGPSSIGRSRAEEAVRLLKELNESADGQADTRNIEDLLSTDAGKEWIASFTIVIAHNLPKRVLDNLAEWLWSDTTHPSLAVVRSAGFLADFYVQYPEHAVIESHSEVTPSLRIDKPFPALKEYALSLDFESMDVTDHGHVPYVYILIRAMEDWKASHDGNAPKTYAERKEFKSTILAMRKKPDEENFEEAEAQAYRVWTATNVPSDTQSLLSLPSLSSLTPTSAPFYHLLAALKEFVESQDHGCLPLSSTLPDMKAATEPYIHLQTLYKRQAETEKAIFKKFIKVPIDDEVVDAFVKNAHALRLLQGDKFGAIDNDPKALVERGIQGNPKATAIHLGLSALASLEAKNQPSAPSVAPTQEGLKAEAQALLPEGTELPEEWDYVGGEIERAPTADLPNTAALLGGLVAQEVIKMITKQYVPINGYCAVDLVETWTGIL